MVDSVVKTKHYHFRGKIKGESKMRGRFITWEESGSLNKSDWAGKDK